MNRSDRNPLRESPGKGDKDRSTFNKKFKENYEAIKWGKSKKEKSKK